MSAPTPLQKLLEDLESKVKRRGDPAVSPNQPENAPAAAHKAPEAASALPKVDEPPSFSTPVNRLVKPDGLPAALPQVTPEAITRHLMEDLHDHLEPLPAKARAFALAFHTAALEAAVRQGMKLRGLSEVALFIPVEAVATSLGIDRVTLWRWFERYPVLRSLIAKREHYGSVTSYTTGGLMTWKTGTIWLVKIKPNLEREARVRYEHLKHDWRDLESDIKRGHTARSQAEAKCNYHKDLEELVAELRTEILKWTLTPSCLKAPLSDRCMPRSVPRHELVGAVLDVEGAPKAKRGEVVDRAARTVAAALGDAHLDVWRWVMWQMLRLDYQGENYFTGVLNVLTRALADREEDFARSASALAISRLKASGIWERLKQAPPLRIGQAPQEPR